MAYSLSLCFYKLILVVKRTVKKLVCTSVPFLPLVFTFLPFS
jgi:hypothetical protein